MWQDSLCPTCNGSGFSPVIWYIDIDVPEGYALGGYKTVNGKRCVRVFFGSYLDQTISFPHHIGEEIKVECECFLGWESDPEISEQEGEDCMKKHDLCNGKGHHIIKIINVEVEGTRFKITGKVTG